MKKRDLITHEEMAAFIAKRAAEKAEKLRVHRIVMRIRRGRQTQGNHRQAKASTDAQAEVGTDAIL